jgi:citrate lyase subunit beta / citryl-CoA lyase
MPRRIEALAPRPVIALCETAAGVLAAPALAAAGNCVGLMWGSEDLVADLGGRPGRTPSGAYPPAVEEARTRILYAARAASSMNIVVLIKQVPDTYSQRKLDASDGILDRDATDAVLDEINERAVEAPCS